MGEKRCSAMIDDTVSFITARFFGLGSIYCFLLHLFQGGMP